MSPMIEQCACWDRSWYQSVSVVITSVPPCLKERRYTREDEIVRSIDWRWDVKTPRIVLLALGDQVDGRRQELLMHTCSSMDQEKNISQS